MAEIQPWNLHCLDYQELAENAITRNGGRIRAVNGGSRTKFIADFLAIPLDDMRTDGVKRFELADGTVLEWSYNATQGTYFIQLAG